MSSDDLSDFEENSSFDSLEDDDDAFDAIEGAEVAQAKPSGNYKLKEEAPVNLHLHHSNVLRQLLRTVKHSSGLFTAYGARQVGGTTPLNREIYDRVDSFDFLEPDTSGRVLANIVEVRSGGARRLRMIWCTAIGVG